MALRRTQMISQHLPSARIAKNNSGGTATNPYGKKEKMANHRQNYLAQRDADKTDHVVGGDRAGMYGNPPTPGVYHPQSEPGRFNDKSERDDYPARVGKGKRARYLRTGSGGLV